MRSIVALQKLFTYRCKKIHLHQAETKITILGDSLQFNDDTVLLKAQLRLRALIIAKKMDFAGQSIKTLTREISLANMFPSDRVVSLDYFAFFYKYF